YKKAIELTRADLRVNADDGTARAALAVCLAKVGDVQGAREAIDAALKLDPTNSLYLYNAAIVANVSGDAATASNYLDAAVMHGHSAAELQRDPEFANLRKTDILTPNSRFGK